MMHEIIYIESSLSIIVGIIKTKHGHEEDLIKKVVGRIYTVSPFDGEKFNLRVLLNHVKGPTRFDDLLTVNGITYPTFKQAAE